MLKDIILGFGKNVYLNSQDYVSDHCVKSSKPSPHQLGYKSNCWKIEVKLQIDHPSTENVNLIKWLISTTEHNHEKKL